MKNIKLYLPLLVFSALTACKNQGSVAAAKAPDNVKQNTLPTSAAKKEEGTKKIAPKTLPSKQLKKEEPKQEDM